MRGHGLPPVSYHEDFNSVYLKTNRLKRIQVPPDTQRKRAPQLPEGTSTGPRATMPDIHGQHPPFRLRTRPNVSGHMLKNVLGGAKHRQGQLPETGSRGPQLDAPTGKMLKTPHPRDQTREAREPVDAATHATRRCRKGKARTQQSNADQIGRASAGRPDRGLNLSIRNLRLRLQTGSETSLCTHWKIDGDGRLGVRRFDRFFPVRQDEPCKDRQGNWKRAWLFDLKGKGQTHCAITDKFVEESSEGKWEELLGEKKTRGG